MLTESNAVQNPAAALTPEIAPRSPWRVTELQVLPGFQLSVAFADGLKGTVNLSALVHSSNAGVFAALSDPALFAQAKLDLGAVTWPGELDLAPDAMHAAIQKHGEWSL